MGMSLASTYFAMESLQEEHLRYLKAMYAGPPSYELVITDIVSKDQVCLVGNKITIHEDVVVNWAMKTFGSNEALTVLKTVMYRKIEKLFSRL